MNREDFLAMCASCAMRHDTLMARAMLRALGMTPPGGYAEGGILPKGAMAIGGVYDGLLECMAQRHGVRL